MSEFIAITGGRRLSGNVSPSGAKNAALPLLFSSILTREECLIENVPDLDDISVSLRLLASLGAETSLNDKIARVRLHEIRAQVAPYHLVKALRASFLVLGPLVARTGAAQVSLPGGDAIGFRPVDLHLRGLARMGADIRMRHGVVYATAPGGLRPTELELDYPSVGATEHLLMTAAGIQGETVIRGAACEPEIGELASCLSTMGALVEGVGTPILRIVGRKELGGGRVRVKGDRIEAATYLFAGAITGGELTVTGVESQALGSILNVLRESGCTVATNDSTIELRAPERLSPVSVNTAPFPGFATDAQPLLMAAMTQGSGTSTITETVFENRFGHVAEFRRLGAEIELNGEVARVSGVRTLTGAPVEAGDIRGAAGLALLGLVAEGTTRIFETQHLARGYENFVDKLKQLGADISRVRVVGNDEIVLGC